MTDDVTCTKCGNTNLTWIFNETKNQNQLWSSSKREWHTCEIISTIVHPKKINWFCWECNHTIDINNHPCIHYQKLNPTERSITRMRAGAKKK